MNTTPDEKTEELNIIRGVLAIARGLLVTTMFTKWSNFYDASTLAKAAGILAALSSDFTKSSKARSRRRHARVTG